MAITYLKKRTSVRRVAGAFAKGFGSVLSIYGSGLDRNRISYARTLSPPELTPMSSFETDRQALGEVWQVVGNQLRDKASQPSALREKSRMLTYLRRHK